MTFRCSYHLTNETKKHFWTGEVKNLIQTATGFEAEIFGRGSSYYVIVGTSQRGKYVCIPYYQVASELASLEDIFWNQNELARAINITDATTIAYAIKEISKNLTAALE